MVVFRLFWGAVSGVAGAWAGLGIKKGPGRMGSDLAVWL